MKRNHSIVCAVLLPILFSVSSFDNNKQPQDDTVNGAWIWQRGSQSTTLVFIDKYAVMTTYDKDNKQFIRTAGGPYSIQNDQLTVQTDFNTGDSTKVGEQKQFKFTATKDELVIQESQEKASFKRLDNGSGELAGVWYIAGRLENGKINERQLGPRRTLKVLSGTRFQWIAINPSVKGFYGTGGGTYTFANGKYTENIEFFSRDNSRVGASLTFDGKIVDGAWHHSGLSSRGEPLNEAWKRLPKNQ
jgi:hypothetical protein